MKNLTTFRQEILSELLDPRVALIFVASMLFFATIAKGEVRAESIMLDDCNLYAEVCTGMSFEDFKSTTILVNGKKYEGRVAACDYSKEGQAVSGQTISLRLGVGEYTITYINETEEVTSKHKVSISCEKTEKNCSTTSVFNEVSTDGVVLDLDAIDLAEYNVFVNGDLANDFLEKGTSKNMNVMNFGEFVGQPFFIHEWNYNGTIVEGMFKDADALATHMSKLTQDEWRWDEKRAILFGGAKAVSIGEMKISVLEGNGDVVELGNRKSEITGNYVLPLQDGVSNVVVTQKYSGCSQSQTVEMNKGQAQIIK